MATQTTSLTVANKSGYTLTINNIPTGSSVTPINDIQTWLHCANIWDKTYTTISQVLSDATVLLALISSNNAADYMARSTSWASTVASNSTAMSYIGNNDYCANKLLGNGTWRTAICNSSYFESVLTTKVPTMTSNTTPSGQVIATNPTTASYEAWKAFDGILDGQQQAYPVSTATTSGWIGYVFPNAVDVGKVFIKMSAAYTNSCLLQYSDNGSSWSNTNLSFDVAATSQATKILGTTYGKHRYWRINMTSSTAHYHGVYELQFYGRT